jgi:pimeloyl-ACP methyl ester carboxylesterase
MRSFDFGTARRLYGVLHEPAGTAKNTGMLLCYPGVQEYDITHWAHRKLASQLAREGFPVLRFDYSNTGDSQGDVYDGDPKAWVEDIAAAADELKDATGVRRVSIVGMRLGAALACQAIAQGLKVSALALWEPILDGAAYVKELERLDEAECSRLQHWPMEPRVELAGFPFSSRVRAAVGAISLRSTPPKAASRVSMFLTASSDDAQAVRAAWTNDGIAVTVQVVEESGGVTAGGARDTAVLYTKMLTAIVDDLKGPPAQVAA